MACKLQGPALETVSGRIFCRTALWRARCRCRATPAHRHAGRPPDHTGGYAKIGTVISADLPALAQLRPGQAVAFDWIDPAGAVAAARRRAALLQQVKERLS